MVATRRKRAADGSSSEEEENPRDADFTLQDDGVSRVREDVFKRGVALIIHALSLIKSLLD